MPRNRKQNAEQIAETIRAALLLMETHDNHEGNTPWLDEATKMLEQLAERLES